MRTSRFLAAALVPLMLASCGAERVHPGEEANERLGEARSVLEERGHAYEMGASGYGEGAKSRGVNWPSHRDSVAVYAWCGGEEQGPTLYLDDEEVADLPCSEGGELNEISAEHPAPGQSFEMRTESNSEDAQWALALGVPNGR